MAAISHEDTQALYLNIHIVTPRPILILFLSLTALGVGAKIMPKAGTIATLSWGHVESPRGKAGFCGLNSRGLSLANVATTAQREKADWMRMRCGFISGLGRSEDVALRTASRGGERGRAVLRT